MKLFNLLPFYLLFFFGYGFCQNEINDTNYIKDFKSKARISDNLKKDVQCHSTPISSLTSLNFTDLNFIQNILDTTSHVFLGESSHFIGDYNSLRVRLIKYFHEKLGYNLLAFESPYSNLNYVSQNRSDIDSIKMLKMGLYSVWHSEELIDLMSYLKNNPRLQIVGFDCKEPSLDSLVIISYSKLFNKLNENFEIKYHEIIKTFKLQMEKKPYNQNESFFKKNDSLVGEIELFRNTLINNQIQDFDILFHLKNLKNSIEYWSILSKKPFSKSMEFRDSLMSENLLELLKVKYPYSKAIVWGHNAHLSKQSVSSNYPKPMGEFLNQKLKFYAIGFYTYGGIYGYMNDANKIKTPKKHNLEYLLNENKMTISFVNLVNINNSSWLKQRFESLDTGHGSMNLIPENNYDAIIFFNNVNKPKYINKK